MRIGRMRHRVRLENPNLIAEETGGQEPDPSLAVADGSDPGWAVVATLWAEVLDISAKERFAVGQLENGVTTNVLMRPHPEVKASSRLVFGERKLYVSGPPIQDPKGRQITLTCQERPAT